jgi:hypothetical protein
MEDRPDGWPIAPSAELLKRILRTMDQEQFNQFVARLWAEHGWETTQESNNSDITVATGGLGEVQYGIYTDEYRTEEVDGELVEHYAARHNAGEDRTAIIVTTGDFSWDANERARILNVKLVDGADLVNRVRSADAYDIINGYSSLKIKLNSASELKQELNQHEAEIARGTRRSGDIKQKPAPPWLTVLPGVELERDWARRFVLAIIAAVTLISAYNFLPTSGPITLRLALVTLYYSAIGAITSVFIAFYMDVELIRRADVHWNPHPLIYLVLVAFTFGIFWGYYFYKRYYHLGGMLVRPSLAPD